MNSTANMTYSDLLARHQKMETEIMGTVEKAPVSPRGTAEYKKAFIGFLRGEPPSNALNIGKESGGNYLVPDDLESRLIDGLEEANVFRKIAHVIQAGHDRQIPVIEKHGEAAWINEGEPIPDSDDKFGQVVLKAHKAATAIRVSEELLDDAGFCLEEYIVREFARRIGDLEESAFVDGTGVGMPTGILFDAPVGVVTENPGKVSLDDMIELEYSVSEKYRKNAMWLFSNSVALEVCKAKDSFGRPLWREAISDGEFDTFSGKPAVICKAMPEIAPGAKAVLFGDFSYYCIADRGRRKFKRLNELYAVNGQIGFLASQRVDAKLILPEAVKCLQIKE